MPVLQSNNTERGDNKVIIAAEETSTCTSLDDSLSSGNSLNTNNSAHATTNNNTNKVEPSMSPLPEGPISNECSSSAGAGILRSKERRVAFNHVHVKEFDRIIGDNPSCSYGVPIS